MQVKDCKTKLGSDLYHILRTKEKLPLKHIMFVAEYVTNGFNATQAYLKSVARKGTKVETAWAMAVRILGNPRVQSAIRTIIDDWLGEKKLKLENEIIEVLYRRAFYDPFMFVNPDGMAKITKAEEVPKEWRCVVDGVEKKYYGKDADVSTVVLKLANKENALRELSKYIELYREAESGLKMTEGTIEKLAQLFGKKPEKKKLEDPKPVVETEGHIVEKVEIN